jgi:Flp pilus assembly protein TadG
MLRRPTRSRRRGATLAEYAVVLSVFFILTFGAVIVGWGMFVSNAVASLAREGARWASVHGGTYLSEYNSSHTPTKSATTASDVYTSGILPRITKSDGTTWLDTSKLTYTVSWLDSSQNPTYKNSSGVTVSNKVTVTVNYSWTPKLYLSPMTLTGSSTMTMSY